MNAEKDIKVRRRNEWRLCRSGIKYMGRPIEALQKTELLDLVIGQDFVIEQLARKIAATETPK